MPALPKGAGVRNRQAFFHSRVMRTGIEMYEYDEHVARAAECQQKAKSARVEDDKHSWLALADSWLQTAELWRVLAVQERNSRAIG